MRICCKAQLALVLLLGVGCAAAAKAQAAAEHEAGAAKDVCELLSEPTVRLYTGVHEGAFARTMLQMSPEWARCVYGVHNGDLVLDVLHLSSDAEAKARIAQFGGITNSDNNTDSPYGEDQVNLSGDYLDPPKGRGFDAKGFAARHGSTIVAIATDTWNGMGDRNAEKEMQGTALTLAGAHLIPWPKQDVCARVPPSAVQTLVALGPADVVSTTNTSSGGNSVCEYDFQPFDQSQGSPYKAEVRLTSSQYINDDEALSAAGNVSAIRPSFTTADPRDVVIPRSDIHAGTTALHAGNLGKVTVYAAETAARSHQTEGLHEELAALLAAGARVPHEAALENIPSARTPTNMDRAVRKARQIAEVGWLPTLIVALLCWPIALSRRKKRLIATGLPGTALVKAIADTGMTINNSPVIRMTLTVNPQGGAPYEATVRQTVSRLEAPASWIGRQVQVRIDRKNPQRLAVVP